MRRLSLFLLAFIGCVPASAQMSICATPGQNNAFLGIQTIRLWSGTAPQAKGDDCKDIPTLTILDPHEGTENGSAVLIFPGGAYRNLAANLEGRQYADWFTARGFQAFILQYRLTRMVTCCRFRCSMRGAPSSWCVRGRATTSSIPIALW